MNADAVAIIVAGGQGLRFGGRVRKQYHLLKRRPVLWWSVVAFEKSPSIGGIILIVPADDLKRMKRSVRSWKIRKLLCVVAGGRTRVESVRQGLAAVPPSFPYVAVHDAVRPLVTPGLIAKTLQAAHRFRAAIAACPSKDTVKLASGKGFIHTSPPRQSVWLAQTPQVFERRLLERAHGLTPGSRLQARGRKLSARSLEPRAVTDDSQLVERLGVKVKLVEAPAENIKITRPADLMVARAVIASGAKQSVRRHDRLPRRAFPSMQRKPSSQ